MTNPDHPPIVPPGIAIFFAILAVSTASIFIRYAQVSVPSLVIAAFRLSLAALILLPISLITRRKELRNLDWGQIRLALLSGFFLALHFASWISSLQYTSVASSVVLVTTTPLWVALIGPLFLKEHINKLVIIGLGVALVGGVVVSASDTCQWSGLFLSCPDLRTFVEGKAFFGDILAVLGAFMAAGYMIIGRRLRTNVSLITYTFVVYGMAAIVLDGMILVTGLKITGYPAESYLWLLALAVIPQLIGHSTFNWSLKYLPVVFVSITLLGEPVGSTILAYLLLGEMPGWVKIAGAVLILGGILIAARPEPHQQKSTA